MSLAWVADKDLTDTNLHSFSLCVDGCPAKNIVGIHIRYSAKGGYSLCHLALVAVIEGLSKEEGWSYISEIEGLPSDLIELLLETKQSFRKYHAKEEAVGLHECAQF